MCRTKVVVLGLGALGKTGDAILLTQATHLIAAASQNLVRIGLVTHIPHNTIVGSLEHIVQGSGQFNRAQIGRQMPTGFGYGLQNKLAQLSCQLGKITLIKLAQVGGRLDLL